MGVVDTFNLLASVSANLQWRGQGRLDQDKNGKTRGGQRPKQVHGCICTVEGWFRLRCFFTSLFCKIGHIVQISSHTDTFHSTGVLLSSHLISWCFVNMEDSYILILQFVTIPLMRWRETGDEGRRLGGHCNMYFFIARYWLNFKGR